MYIVGYITAKNSREAGKISNVLVEQKLVACVNIVKDISSIYAWKGKICKDKEVMMVFKTRKSLLNKVIVAVKKIHSYDVPEIIAMPIVGGSQEYLNWVKQSTRSI